MEFRARSTHANESVVVGNYRALVPNLIPNPNRRTTRETNAQMPPGSRFPARDHEAAVDRKRGGGGRSRNWSKQINGRTRVERTASAVTGRRRHRRAVETYQRRVALVERYLCGVQGGGVFLLTTRGFYYVLFAYAHANMSVARGHEL